MSSKKSFIAYNDWRNAFDKMPDEAAGKLIKALFAFANGEDVSDLDWSIAAPLEQYKSIILRDSDKWDKQVEQRSLAGKKSAESRQRKATRINDRSTTVDSRERKPTDSVSGSSSVSVSESVSESKKTYLDLTPEEFLQEIKDLSEEKKVFSVIGINEFYNHWSEMTPKGKMKFQTQNTWNTLMRMKKWAANNYSGKSKYDFKGNEFRNLVY